MLLQAITIDDRAYEVEKASKSFINTHIFPGRMPASLESSSRNLARRTDMQTVSLEDLTPHYVETLRRWRKTFTAHAPALAELGLRRALPPALDALPRLLPSRLLGAADLRRPAAADQARSRIASGTYRTGFGHSPQRDLR